MNSANQLEHKPFGYLLQDVCSTSSNMILNFIWRHIISCVLTSITCNAMSSKRILQSECVYASIFRLFRDFILHCSAISNMGYMHSVSANQIADILTPRNKRRYFKGRTFRGDLFSRTTRTKIRFRRYKFSRMGRFLLLFLYFRALFDAFWMRFRESLGKVRFRGD